MAMEIRKDDFYVRVEPFVWFPNMKKPAEFRQHCKELVDQIKRHVDGVHSVSIEFSESPVCAHCGSGWTEKGVQYNGGCCDADQAPFDACDALFGFIAALNLEAR